MIALYIMGIHPVDMMFTSLEEAAVKALVIISRWA